MAVFKQPRVPEYHEGKGVNRYLHDLVRFLRDFTHDAWTANRQNAQTIESLRNRVEALEGKTDA